MPQAPIIPVHRRARLKAPRANGFAGNIERADRRRRASPPGERYYQPMTPQLNLTFDELLTTTRSVRKRLDFTRPVERETLEECFKIAQQSPTGGNNQRWHFVAITDPAKRLAVAEIYRRGWAAYTQTPVQVYADEAENIRRRRVRDSADYLAEHMHEVPVLVLACVDGRTDGKSAFAQSGTWGSILPAVWSFMLAARARGLGTCWTTVHLRYEAETAELLGIPYDRFMQTALIPVGYTKGTDFKPVARQPLDQIVHWDQW